MANFMQQAVDEAVQGVQKGDGGPFGALVVKDGQIIASGHNMVLITKDPTAHAEVTAIRMACAKLGTFDLKGCVLYTSCHPCPMCMGASLWARLDAVYYAATPEQAANVGFDDKAFYDYINSPNKNEEMCRLEHVEIDQYLKPFELWSSLESKTPY
uniref:CMP/dCMP-type deaminase domain-containing protein n=1 Tax=Plectus sambesii TaxID=2011161 RepID=A0A914XJA1_9BILA